MCWKADHAMQGLPRGGRTGIRGPHDTWAPVDMDHRDSKAGEPGVPHAAASRQDRCRQQHDESGRDPCSPGRMQCGVGDEVAAALGPRARGCLWGPDRNRQDGQVKCGQVGGSPKSTCMQTHALSHMCVHNTQMLHMHIHARGHLCAHCGEHECAQPQTGVAPVLLGTQVP